MLRYDKNFFLMLSISVYDTKFLNFNGIISSIRHLIISLFRVRNGNIP